MAGSTVRKSQIQLHFPAGGVDRSVGFQWQPPYTASKAQNVWPTDVVAGRERGGSRPGLGPFVREKLGNGPVRMLGKVGIVVEPGNTNQQGLTSTQFQVPGPFTHPDYSNLTWVQPLWADYGMKVFGVGAISNGPGLGAAINIHSNSRQSGDEFEYGFQIVPTAGDTAGTYKLYFDVDNALIGARELSLTLDGLGGYSGDLDGTAFSGTIGDPGGGWLSLKIVKNGGNYDATAYWRSSLLATKTAFSLSNLNWGLGVDWGVATTGGAVSAQFAQYPTTQRQEYRKEILCAVSNQDLYYETAPRTMTKLTTTHKFTNSRRIENAEYLQKLYICDYGTVWKGTDGILTGATTFTNAAATNFQNLGVDSKHVLYLIDTNASQNEIQTVTFTAVTGGTFTLTFNGETTGNIAYNASAATVEAALEALSSFGSLDIAVGGAAGAWTFVFMGQYAGTDVDLLYVDSTALTGGGLSVTVTETQSAFSGQTIIKSYPIASVSGGTITLSSGPTYPGALSPLTSLEFLICRPTRVFDPKALTLTEFTATTGIAPIGCRLICKYLDRLVLAAAPDAPHLWFMSRQGDVTDWDYGQLDAGAPVSSSVNTQGEIGDPITALIPHTDQCLIFGCYSSLWILRGDPASGGSLDPISKKIGIVDAAAWCHLPTGEVVFLSQDGLYIFPAGCHGTPASLSRERLPLELVGLSPSQVTAQLEWDTDFRGIHIFVTREDGGFVYHYWFDWQSKSFWPVRLQKDHEPLSTIAYTPVNAGQYVVLGGRDGYLRHFDRHYFTDDGGTQIDSFVDIGPVKIGDGTHEGLLSELNITLGRGSGEVDYSVMAGQTAEDAAYGDRVHSTGVFGQRLNYTARPRARGAAFVLRLAGKEKKPWFYETGVAIANIVGKVRRRWG